MFVIQKFFVCMWFCYFSYKNSNHSRQGRGGTKKYRVWQVNLKLKYKILFERTTCHELMEGCKDVTGYHAKGSIHSSGKMMFNVHHREAEQGLVTQRQLTN